MNPVFIEIFGLKIHYYGLMYALSFIIGISLAKRMARERNFDENIIDNYSFVAIISGLLGGRLYYVMFNWNYFSKFPLEILAVWNGGMAIHGGIIGGIIGTIIYCKIKNTNPLELGDYAAAPLILGQALGRIGNLMNGEIHGVPTFTPLNIIFSIKPKFYEWYDYYNSLSIASKMKFKNLVPWGVVFPSSSPAGSEFPNLALHPAMMYESILNFIGFLYLWFVVRKKTNLPKGYMWLTYIIIYSVNRIIVSFFRAEDLMIHGIRAPHLVSLIFIFGSLLIMAILKRKNIK